MYFFFKKFILQTFSLQLIKRFNNLITCWALSYSFLYLRFLFMFILCITLLPKDRAHAIPAEIGTTIIPTPVTDNVTSGLVQPLITTVWTDSNIEVSVLCFFFVLWFLFLK